MRVPYKLFYRVGLTPWERLPTLPAAKQISTLLEREQNRRQPPHGKALDLGCGSGIWSVELARRGWDVTGIDMIPKAVLAARERARQARFQARFLAGDVTTLRETGVGAGFRLVLDFGTVHGLTRAQRQAVGREVSAVATADATLLMYAAAPGRRGPLPRGASREEIQKCYPGWTVIDEEPFDVTGAPGPFRHADPRWYRLRRA
ncbi:MAG TPA: class I SAM-dependent methyltransferase [Candidatus Limnocylindria bacterium]|nr:class I SAM-dependent methyltransferase [Candidatus Limnocylindria bacterium]